MAATSGRRNFPNFHEGKAIGSRVKVAKNALCMVNQGGAFTFSREQHDMCSFFSSTFCDLADLALCPNFFRSNAPAAPGCHNVLTMCHSAKKKLQSQPI